MGTYPTTPSYVLSSGELLQDVLNANKEKLIGKTVLDKFGADLPFLPKVSSPFKPPPVRMLIQSSQRFFQWRKPFLSRSTQTKTSPPASTRKTPRSTVTRTTSRKSLSHSPPSSSSSASSHSTRSKLSSNCLPSANSSRLRPKHTSTTKPSGKFAAACSRPPNPPSAPSPPSYPSSPKRASAPHKTRTSRPSSPASRTTTPQLTTASSSHSSA